MDSSLAILIGLVVIPVLILFILRINATMVFLGLCLGYVLMQFLGGNARSFANAFMPNATVSTSVMKLVLLIFPAVFIAFFMVHTVRRSRLIINILPALSVGCLLTLLVVPLLPLSTYYAIVSTPIWQQVLRLQDTIIGMGALISLFSLWLLRTKKLGKKRIE